MPARETVRFSLTFLVWASTLGGCSDALDPPEDGGAGSGGTALAGAAGASAGGTAGAAAGAGGTAGSHNATGAGGSGTGGAVATGGTGGAGAAGGIGTGGSAATAGTGGAAVGGSGGAVAGGAGAGGTGADGGGSGAGGATGGSGAGGDGAGGTAAGEGGTAGAGASGGGAGGNAGTAGTAGTSSDPPEPGVVGEPIGFASENGGTTGGRGGQVVTARTFAELAQYASASGPYVILIEGTISNGSGGGRVSVSSNKSLVGLGSTAFLQGVGLEIKNSNNVIVQNLKITLVGTTTPTSVNGGDAIVINGTSKNVWIDHCELYAEDPTVQTNIDKYDGLIDIRDQTGFITVSWSYLHDHHKACLVGASDEDLHDDRKVTYHHNYFRKIVKRMPMYRGSIGHFFNNYVVGVSTTEATFMVMGTCVRVEKNVYETVKYAIYSATDGTRGSAQRIDNIGSQSRAWPADCTANIPYDYSDVLIENTNDVKTLVPAGAGVGKL